MQVTVFAMTAAHLYERVSSSCCADHLTLDASALNAHAREVVQTRTDLALKLVRSCTSACVRNQKLRCQCRCMFSRDGRGPKSVWADSVLSAFAWRLLARLSASHCTRCRMKRSECHFCLSPAAQREHAHDAHAVTDDLHSDFWLYVQPFT